MGLLTTIIDLATSWGPALLAPPSPESSARKRFIKQYGSNAYDAVLGAEAHSFLDAALAMPGWSWALKVESRSPDKDRFVVSFTDHGSKSGLLDVDLTKSGSSRYRIESSAVVGTETIRSKNG